MAKGTTRSPDRAALDAAILKVVEWRHEVDFLEQQLGKVTAEFYAAQRDLDLATAALATAVTSNEIEAARYLHELPPKANTVIASALDCVMN
jgi:hypothetical protein